MSAGEVLRLAITGLGRMGLRHAANADASARIELVAVADLDLQKARAAAAKFGTVAYAGTDVERLLADERPDALLIATPAGTHAALIELAAAHGVHVFCEKPLSNDGHAAARAVERAAAAGIRLQLGFQMRFDRDLARVADLVRSGELGQAYQLRASLRDAAPPSREYLAASGGYYWDGMIHLLDLARWYMGDVDEITAFGTVVSGAPFDALDDVDTAMCVLRFRSGALGALDITRVAGYGFESGVEVIGSAATARVPGGRVDGIELLTPGRISTAHATDFLQRFAPAYPHELDGFADAVANGAAPRVDGEDGLAAMRLAAAAELSQRERRTVAVNVDTFGW